MLHAVWEQWVFVVCSNSHKVAFCDLLHCVVRLSHCTCLSLWFGCWLREFSWCALRLCRMGSRMPHGHAWKHQVLCAAATAAALPACTSSSMFTPHKQAETAVECRVAVVAACSWHVCFSLFCTTCWMDCCLHGVPGHASACF
jgi:hypothetical protein